MGHERLTDSPEELEMFSRMLEKRVAELKERAAKLEDELRLVNEKLARLTKGEAR